MSTPSYQRIAIDGLWTNNAGLVQLLGLCPLLAVTGTVVNGLGLGLATTLTLVVSNLLVSSTRHIVRPEVRIPVFVLIIASTVTAIELAMNAYFYELFQILGIFIPLIVTNCTIIGRAEAFASRNDIKHALADGLSMGLGFTGVLVALGALREALGHGTLFAQAHLMLGDWAQSLKIQVLPEDTGVLLVTLPPGAFLGMGLLIAIKNAIDAQHKRRAQAAKPKLAGAQAAA